MKATFVSMLPSEGDLWVWWTVRTEAPYFEGEEGVDYSGPFNSVELARAYLEEQFPELKYKVIPKVRLDETSPEYFEKVTQYYGLDFELPHDEMTDYFEPGFNCALAISLSPDVQIQVESLDSGITIVNVNRQDADLRCQEKIPGGSVRMAMDTLVIDISKPRCMRDSALDGKLAARASMPLYYDEAFDTKLVVLNN